MELLKTSNPLDAITEETNIPEDPTSKKERDKYYGEHKRKERFKNVMNWVFICFIIIISIVATGTIGVRIVHLILPPDRQWMSAEQIQGIDKLFFSGAIGGILVSYFKKVND
jgi:hypothetical protein